MGLAHLASGDIELAVDELLSAARTFPDDPEVTAALEQAFERLTGGRVADGLGGKAAGESPARASVRVEVR